MVDLPLPIPARIAALPRDPRGFPIPWFVAEQPDGTRDFRVAAERKLYEAHNKKLCWVCGQPRGKFGAFVIGPMCAINRTISEPPSHRECAEWSARACPFMTKPRMRRNEKDLPEDRKAAAGNGIKRNPGAVCVWITTRYRPEKVGNGVLFRIGEPTETLWFAEGRTATRAEVQASIDSGLHLLQAEATREGPDAEAALVEYIKRAEKYLPAA